MAHHRNIFVQANGAVCELEATIFREKQVRFFPAHSEQTITVTFDALVPFSDWNTNTQTGDKGEAIKGKVDKDATGAYSYSVASHPGATPNRSGGLGNPKLIVDGGLVPPGKG